jgi:CheY-like chemotaxis protein
MNAPEVGSAPGLQASAHGDQGDQLCSGLTFLVVEDHEFQRGMIVRTLQRLGAANVQGFARGAEALDAARSVSQPNAILMLDLRMPTHNGIDIARIAGKERLRVSVILHSAQSETILLSRIEEARSGGVAVLGAIGKPLTAAKLAPLIATHRRLMTGTAAGAAGSS